ncbi:hypothetical protein J7L65_04540 [Candidatus Bathyarchaeota archaeon]|nr:hypothetical protein [Candidatus Bathyarchaeota archaeon]
MISVQVVAFLGIFTGVLLRTLLPAIRKALENPEFEWNHAYTGTALTAILVALLVALRAYPMFQMPQGGALVVYSQALLFGLGLNSLINEAYKWLEPASSPLMGNREKGGDVGR